MRLVPRFPAPNQRLRERLRSPLGWRVSRLGADRLPGRPSWGSPVLGVARPGLWFDLAPGTAREEFLRIGGFDERFRTAEDREFCDRWQHAGLALVFEPECVVSHAHEMGLAGFLRQHFAYGRGVFCFHAMRARRHGGVKIVEWPYYRTLFTSLLPPRGAHATPLLAVSLLAAQVANLVGFFYERLRHRRAP